MIHKCLFMLVVCFLTSAYNKAGAQSLVIITNDGSEIEQSFDHLQSLNFSNDYLSVRLTDATTSEYAVANLSRLYFNNVVMGVENDELIKNEKLTLSPNPVQHTLCLLNVATQGNKISIFRIDGSIALETYTTSNEPNIDVSNLKCGLYILKINNQVAKFQKL